MLRTMVIMALMLRLVAVKAQLAGTYSVGAGGDFADIVQALDSAASGGLLDSTEFVVAPEGAVLGTLFIPPLSGASATRPLIIRSSEPDSTAVVLGRVEMIEAAHIRFEGLTLAVPPGAAQGALWLFRCRDIALSRCRLVELAAPAYAFNEALVNVQLPSALPTGDVLFDRCALVSAGRVLRSMGPHGMLWFSRSTLEGTFDIPGGAKRFDDCTIRSLAVDASGVQRFLRCTFTSPSVSITLRGTLVKDCDFACNVDLSVNEARGNTFRNVRSFQGNGLFAGNQADTARFIYTHGKPLVGNRFTGPVNTSGDNMRMYNNSFDDELLIVNGPGQIVRYNSFGPGAFLKTRYCGGVAEFNSLWNVDIWQHGTLSLRNNNYANLSSSNVYHMSYDEHPSFHDPQHDTTAGYWKATNPLLTGKSSTLADWGVLDIDSVPRLLPDASAANTICITASNLPDSLRLLCGERIALRLCPGQEHLVLTPLPWNGAIDMSILPMGQGMNIYLADTSGLVLDSCWIVRESFPDLGPVQLYTYCGFPVEMHALYPLFADSMRWEPSWLFDDPTQPFQTVQCATSILLTSTVFSSMCGSFQETFQLNVADIPYAYFTEAIGMDTVHFEAWASCCDSIQWGLGDGTTSTESSLTHVYQSNGSFLVTLTCWLLGDSGVTYTYVYIQGVGLEEHEPAVISAHPNPANTYLRIAGDLDGTMARVRFMDMLGRSVLETRTALPLTLDVGHLSTGRYTILIEHLNGRSLIPLIIQRE